MIRPTFFAAFVAAFMLASITTPTSHAQDRDISQPTASSAHTQGAETPAPISQSDQRPAWESPERGVRLAARDVLADASFPLPQAGEGFYLFTSSILQREQIAELDQDGARYLGLLGQRGYAFLLKEEANHKSLRSLLQSQPNLYGSALAQAADRVDVELLEAHESARNAADAQLAEALEYPLSVTLWPRTTRAEAEALLSPQSLERLQLPSDRNDALRLENRAWVPQHASTLAELQHLAASPFVARLSLRYDLVLHNRESRALSNADAVIAAPLNLSGAGVLVGHWDGGAVQDSHQDFGGRVTNEQNAGISGHATHTAGTILGSGAGAGRARGYAPDATMVAYDFAGDALGERRSARHQFRHTFDNHSWGNNSTNFGGYDGTANEFDVDSRDLFILPVKSAGNDGQLSQVIVNNYGFDSIDPSSNLKNGLCIGATQDGGDLTSFSARGPSNDGRIKPDISANGDRLYSTYPTNTYSSQSGTSMSAPSVTGMITLLEELHRRLHNDARMLPDITRGVLLHTVQDWFHPGPDYRHGFGNADVEAAANFLIADEASGGKRMVRGAVRDGEMVEWALPIPANQSELKVTMNWLDAFTQSTAQRQLNHDLDLVLIDPMGAQHFPWTLDPANPFDDAVRTQRNALDNVEQVLVENPMQGNWILRVVGTSINDPDLSVQGFVLCSSHDVTRAPLRVRASLGTGGTAIPDNNQQGALITLNASSQGFIHSLRLTLGINHPARGDLRIEFSHPDGTTVVLETEDTSSRDDIYGVFPDTRNYDDDTMPMHLKPADGDFEVRVIDTRAGSVGAVEFAELEIEVGGVPGGIGLPNDDPIADAGSDETVRPGDLVELDGTASSDPNNDPITYQWTQTSGTAVTLNGADGQRALFNAPQVASAETLEFQLEVMDDKGASATDTVSITVDPNLAPPNQPPVIALTSPTQVGTEVQVTIDASATTDPEGDGLSFFWTQSGGPMLTLGNTGAAMLTFTTPDLMVASNVVIRLTVSDAHGAASTRDVVMLIDPAITTDTSEPVDPLAKPPKKTGDGCALPARDFRSWIWLALLLGLTGLAAGMRRAE